MKKEADHDLIKFNLTLKNGLILEKGNASELSKFYRLVISNYEANNNVSNKNLIRLNKLMLEGELGALYLIAWISMEQRLEGAATVVAQLKLHANEDFLSAFLLGLAYENGYGVWGNLDNARMCFATSYSLNNELISAKLHFAKTFLFSPKVKNDSAEAKKVYSLLMSMDANDVPLVWTLLAYCKKEGFGCEKNEKEAEALLFRAVDKNEPMAIYVRGLYFYSIYNNTNEALRYFKIAAAQNYAPAITKISEPYYLQGDMKISEEIRIKAVNFFEDEALYQQGMICKHFEKFEQAGILLMISRSPEAKEALHEMIAENKIKEKEIEVEADKIVERGCFGKDLKNFLCYTSES